MGSFANIRINALIIYIETPHSTFWKRKVGSGEFFFVFHFFNLYQMKIIPISVLDDNYSYILIDEKTKEAAVVDPVEPIKILNVISQTGAKLSR